MSGGGFKSYVDLAEKEYQRNEKLTKAYKKAFEVPEQLLEQHLLPGEIAIGHAKKVIKYGAHDDPSKGTSGTLICTNFRISFITTERPKYNLIEINNLLLSKEDILLNSVEHIYVEQRNKRKRLTPGSRVKDGIERLELHCKDFRIAAFNFKFTLKGEEKTVIKAILHHSYPGNITLLFAFDFQHNNDVNTTCTTPLYRNHRDWMESLKHCKADHAWRVTSINENFTVSPTMSSYFVVPRSLTDSDLSGIGNQYHNDRIPYWCWSSTNGCSIMRSSEMRSESELAGQKEAKFRDAVQSDGSEFKHLRVVDITKSCPTVAQIQQSFLKLKNLCMPATEADYWETDGHWLSSVHATKWLHHVNAMLSTANDVSMWVAEKDHHVIVREQSGIDITPVITSLSQIILDPHSRTLGGLQALIQREWVIGGFPFMDRLGHLHQPTANADESTEMSPVFLLFLDCIHQLVLQNPTKFGFNSTFLVVLSDALRLTAFDTFIFNNERERSRRLDQSEQRMRDSSWQSLPLWAWGAQYKPQDMKIFNNPLYMLQDADFYGVDSLDLSLVTSSTYSRLSASDTPLNGFAEDSGSGENDSDGASPLADENLQIRYNTRTGVVNLGGDTPGADKKKKKTFSIRRKRPKDDGDEGKGSTDNEEANGVSEVETFNTTMQERMKRPLTLCKDPQMVVRTRVANMRWWSLCYHRWMPWSQSFGGGPSEMHRQESVLFDEIHALYCKLKQSLEDDITTHPDDITTSSSDDSGMYFPHTPPVNPPHLVSNFYPYSPVQELGRKSVLGTPLFDFIHGNPIFDFGQKVKSKHSRSASQFSITGTSSDENNSSKAMDKSPTTSSLANSADNSYTTTQTQKKPPISPAPKPKKPLMPPADRISYVSSV